MPLYRHPAGTELRVFVVLLEKRWRDAD